MIQVLLANENEVIENLAAKRLMEPLDERLQGGRADGRLHNFAVNTATDVQNYENQMTGVLSSDGSRVKVADDAKSHRTDQRS